MPEPFAWQIEHWASADALRAHLARHTPPPWLRGTLHHTVKPLPAAWRGRASMERLRIYYRDEVVWYDAQGRRRKGWSSGPHLFVCVGSAGFDGIWQGTPLNTTGTHAGACNAHRVGIEVVGNYDRAPWPPALEALVLGAVRALLDWGRLAPADVVGHRDCGSRKTCPGRAISLDYVRGRL